MEDNNPAGRLDMVMKLYQSGLLCSCNQYDEIYDEETGTHTKEIRHYRDCMGRLKVQEMIGYKEVKNG